ncbi:hypothetical protein VTN77DRAFT_6256 [Rasamsonia byssochlamydoides]|uniref:uncharacterized protein n=1 Tax=Rasamsonia byssochlamydoides TaxID=89139 RepID=UPI0037421801
MADAALSPDVARQDKGPAIVAIQWTFTAIATVFVAARLLCYLCYLFDALTTASVQAGNGKHASTLTLSQLENAIMLNTAGFIPGILGFVTPKLAVVALLTKILNPSRVHRIFLWFLTLEGGVIICGCIIILYAQCDPPKSMWIVTIQNAKCWDPYILVDYAIFAGALSAAIDLYLAVYPAVALCKLQMNIKKKVALSTALGLGSCASAVAIYKCTRLPGLADHSDFTYGTADLVIWTSIEGNTIIIAACIPTLAPLIELALGKRALGSGSDPDYYNHYGYGKRKSGHVRTPNIELSSSRLNRSAVVAATGETFERPKSILPADEPASPCSVQIQTTINVSVDWLIE